MPRRRPVTLNGGFIRQIKVTPPVEERDRYPLNLPALRGVEVLDLDPSMTIFVGENGSGKSTLIEGVAVAAGFNAEGGSINFNFSTSGYQPELADHLRLVRNPYRPRTGFFLRAESFFNVATEIERLDPTGADIAGAYGPRPLHKISHGEGFLALALHRFKAGGLYVLDEPEAALSPTGCLQLLRRMHDLVGAGSQFIIATHSPLVMSFPGARIYLLSEKGPRNVAWEDLDHVRITREFLNHPGAVLDELLRRQAGRSE